MRMRMSVRIRIRMRMRNCQHGSLSTIMHFDQAVFTLMSCVISNTSEETCDD